MGHGLLRWASYIKKGEALAPKLGQLEFGEFTSPFHSDRAEEGTLEHSNELVERHDDKSNKTYY